jgi:hypothetical protein
VPRLGIPRVETGWRPRRPMHYTAWAYSADGLRPYECMVSDVSDIEHLGFRPGFEGPRHAPARPSRGFFF